MNIKTLHFFLIIVYFLVTENLFSQPLTAQQNELAHRRYWYYRTRFINDFIKLGGNQGEGIAFTQRNFEYTSSSTSLNNIYTANSGPDQIDITNMYLITLSLEYKLLSRSNQSTAKTIEEIYQLLYTLNRLDLEAENVWTSPPSYVLTANGSLNGFILREDVPNDFVANNNKHFNYAINEFDFNPSNNIQSYTGLIKIDNVSGDNKFKIYNQNPFIPSNKKELSLVHDKYHSMLAALMFIVKYIPSSAKFIKNNSPQPFQDGETSIKQEAIEIANRIQPYLKGNTFDATPNNDWTIKQPDGSDIGYWAGAGAGPYSFALSRMICHVNNGFPWNWYNNCTTYQDVTSITAGLVSYNLLTYTGVLPTIYFPNNPSWPSYPIDLAVFMAWDNACTNYPVANPNTNLLPTIPCNVAMKVNTGIHSLEWAELMRKVLFQSGLLLNLNTSYANPLNIAPCKGPYNFGNGVNCDYPNIEWSSQDRTEHPNAKGKGCNNNGGAFRGNYPGVDYMLLHNLYYEHLNQLDDANLKQTAAYKNAYNLMDNYDEMIWPFSFTTGSQFNLKTILFGVNSETVISNPPMTTYTRPGRIKLFQNLTSRAQIYGSASPSAPTNTVQARVDYRAGKEISLLPEDGNQPGFEVKLGAEFHARIKRYVCGDEDYTNGMRQAENGNADYASSDYESDDMNTEIPIHYVDYPELSDADKYPVIDEQAYYGSNEIMPEQTITKTNEELLIQQTNTQNGIDSYSLENSKRFEVLPNPNNGVFKIIVNKISTDEIITISILDMKGNIIYSNPNFLTKELDFSNYAKGIYMIQLNSNKGYKNSKRINIVE